MGRAVIRVLAVAILAGSLWIGDARSAKCAPPTPAGKPRRPRRVFRRGAPIMAAPLAQAQRVAIVMLEPRSPEEPTVTRLLESEHRRELPKRDRPRGAAGFARVGAKEGDPSAEAPPVLEGSLPDHWRAVPSVIGARMLACVFPEARTEAVAIEIADAIAVRLPEIARPLASAALAGAIRARLENNAGVAVAAQADVDAAVAEIRRETPSAGLSELARRLCERLNCQAALAVDIADFSWRQESRSDLSLWVRVRAFEPARTGPATATGAAPAISEQTFTVGSAVSSGTQRFRSEFASTGPQLAEKAATKAAALLVHTLQTGEIGPFMQGSERVAVTPLALPARMDRLLFTAQGRRMQTLPLPEDLVDTDMRLAPDFAPIQPEDVVAPEETARELEAEKGTPSALWTHEGAPDPVRVQALGRKLHVDYLWMTRIASLETAAGLEEPPRERQARAQASGALVRTSDGRILWQDRADATMTALPERNGRPIPMRTEAEVGRDAIRFALVQLQRQFAEFRAGYER